MTRARRPAPSPRYARAEGWGWSGNLRRHSLRAACAVRPRSACSPPARAPPAHAPKRKPKAHRQGADLLPPRRRATHLDVGAWPGWRGDERCGSPSCARLRCRRRCAAAARLPRAGRSARVRGRARRRHRLRVGWQRRRALQACACVLPRSPRATRGPGPSPWPTSWTCARGGRGPARQALRGDGDGGLQRPPKASGKKVSAGVAALRVEHLELLAGLAASGALKPVIDRTAPLEQAAEAHAYLDSGRKRGSVVLSVARAERTCAPVPRSPTRSPSTSWARSPAPTLLRCWRGTGRSARHTRRPSARPPRSPPSARGGSRPASPSTVASVRGTGLHRPPQGPLNRSAAKPPGQHT